MNAGVGVPPIVWQCDCCKCDPVKQSIAVALKCTWLLGLVATLCVLGASCEESAVMADVFCTPVWCLVGVAVE